MGLMQGKKGIVFGVANDKSIAWACARELISEGAEIAFTYQNKILEKRVRPLAESVNSPIIEPCDVSNDIQIEELFDKLRDMYGGLDFLIHAVAFANKEELAGKYIDTSRDGFRLALDISAFSLTALCRKAAPLMKERQGSIITLTYYGAERVVPNYNVMGVAKAALEASVKYLAVDLGEDGIRINAISAGPVKTLAAMGISGFRGMLHHVAEKSPLKRNIVASEVGKTALYLCSSLSSGMTGETLHIDSGYHVMGM